jgi:membrane fusion protein, multidrug efflux system
MKLIVRVLLVLLPALVVASCSEKDPIQAKLKQIQEYKSQISDLKAKIEVLEIQLAEEDPEYAKETRKATLVTTLPIVKDKFEHFVAVSGNVESRRNIVLSAESMGNVVQIPVKEGDYVKQGSLIIALDSEILENNIAEVKTQLELAKIMFEKQAKLWEQHIGTEVQYLQTKNNKESLERRLATLKAQLSKNHIYAPFDGNIDKINVRVGEKAQPGMPLARIVSQKDMYIKADLSESFVGRFKSGDEVLIDLPSLDKKLSSTISAVGEVINPANRTFSIEVKLPAQESVLKPNMLAILKVKDFEQQDAVAVPVNLIQRDNHGEFVFIVDQSSQTPIAKKVHIERGLTYKDRSLILNGLSGGELLIDKGFREVNDGMVVKEVEGYN